MSAYSSLFMCRKQLQWRKLAAHSALAALTCNLHLNLVACRPRSSNAVLSYVDARALTRHTHRD